ncbi:hypothetical protein TAL182_PC00201 (plasmid) [Rhizobium sp. TAL182]|nr:hypothetical protein TAL182_PC00201 [Rhizobium sp. TAL182]
MASAIAMLREDLPEEVASLDSRVIFSIDGRGDALVLTTGPHDDAVGILRASLQYAGEYAPLAARGQCVTILDAGSRDRSLRPSGRGSGRRPGG